MPSINGGATSVLRQDPDLNTPAPPQSYYGGLLCCAFSQDGRYLAAAGEDDLVSMYSVAEREVVAWGEGHSSWVTAVAFDPW